MANQRGRGRETQRTAARDNRKNVPPEETQPSSRMECDDTTPNAAPDGAETSELQRILSLLESAANSEVQEDQSTDVLKNFQFDFKLLVPLLRSHLRRTAPTAPDKIELKAAIVDERRSRTVIFKNVQESTKSAAVARASEDLTAVNEVLNYLDIAAVVESSYRMPSRFPNDNRSRLLCVVLPNTHCVSQLMARKKNLAQDARLKKISVNRSLTKEQLNAEYVKRKEKRQDLGTAVKSRASPSCAQASTGTGGAGSAQSNSASTSSSHSPPSTVSQVLTTPPIAPPRKMARRSVSQAPPKNF